MNRVSFSSLRVRLILLVLLSLVPAFGLIFYEAREERLHATAAAGEKALALARNAVTEQGRLIAETRRFLGQLAQEGRWWLTLPTSCSALVADHVERHPEYLNLGVINLKGDLICSALPFKGPVNAADRTYFRRTVDTRDFSVGEYQIGRVTGRATVNFGYPEFDDIGRLRAVVFAALDVTVIEQVFVQAKRDEGSVLLMLDLKGMVLSRYPDPEKWVGKPFTAPSILKAIQAKQDEIKEQVAGVDGVERLYAFSALRLGGDVAGFVGVGIPVKVAFAEAKRSLINNLVSIGLASVLVLVAAWFGSDLFVLRQVSALVSATKRLGSGDLSARTGLPYSQSELGQLARSFDETAASLQTITRRNELILTSAGEGIYGVDLEGKTTFINPAAAKMLGYEPSELIGQSMHALAHHSKPDETLYPKEECPIYAAFMDGAIHHIDDEVFWRKDRTSFWVEYVSTPVRENGKILGAVVTFKDITERKKAEEDLRARYQELQTLHEIGETILTAPDLKTTLERILDEAVSIGPFDLGTILLVDPSGEKIQTVASRGYQDPTNLQRRPREEVPGKAQYRALSYQKTYVVENVAEADGLRTLKREGIQSAVLAPVRAAEKTLGFIQVGSRTQRKFNPDKIRLLEATGNQMGIAIQKARLYEETKRNLERIRALHEIDLAITSTLDVRIVLEFLLNKIDVFLPQSSATTIRLFNRESGLLEPVACRNLNELAWKAEVGRAGRGLANVVFETKVPLMVRNAQADPRTRDREFFARYGLVSYLGVPLMAKREVLGVLGFYTKDEHQFGDEEIEFLKTLAGQAAIAIHNAKLYEETKKQAIDLEKSNKVKDEFLSVMSHELRTPLNVVVGYAGMIQDEMLGEINPKQADACAKIVRRTNDLLGMVDSILYTTSLEANEIKVEAHEVNLGDFLNELKSSLSTPPDKDLSLRWDYPSNLPTIRTDSAKLKHVLQNLINNAVKFTEKGTVTISAKRIEDVTDNGRRHVEFKVADTGIGIPKEKVPIIFDKFYQVDSSETRLYGGVGLGLYIAREFSHLIGGKIEVESEPGKGSTFTVTIPYEN